MDPDVVRSTCSTSAASSSFPLSDVAFPSFLVPALVISAKVPSFSPSCTANPSELGAGHCLLLILPPITTAMIGILLDERYGVKHLPLHRHTVCKSIIWKVFSPTTVNIVQGPEFEFQGAIVAFFHLLFTWKDKGHVFHESFWRLSLQCHEPLGQHIYLFGRGRTALPIKLFYTSDMPIKLEPALMSNSLADALPRQPCQL
ncbi:hypothetical protein FB451DRAFT_1408891 [Mycena latifolia]|nr:hypothetical protein FB451DRAFT_1408891 [Mycena latifolia]